MRAASWSLLSEPERAVAREVLIHGPLSRTDLARRLSLSTASLTRLTKPLIDHGLLQETDAQQQSRMGRPSLPLEMVADSFQFVGFNLAGIGSLDGVLIDVRAQVIRSVTATLRSAEPGAIADHIASLTAELGGTPSAIGVSLGGHTRDDSVVRYAPFLHWTDVPLAALIREKTGLPTVVVNDLTALTRAEHWFGAARDCSRFAVLTIGVGVGYGLVMHNQVVTSPDSGLGLIGHYPLDPSGPVCNRGHRGCAHAMLTQSSIADAASAAVGRPVGYQECLDLAAAGDPGASLVVSKSGHALGRLIAAVANLTMPERIILSGEGIRLATVAADAVQAGIAVDRDPAADPLHLDIQQIDFGEWARGAAVSALQKFLGAK